MEKKLIPWWPDAGEALGGLGRTTVYQLIKSGELPSVTIGRRRFVVVDGMNAFIEGRQRAESEQSGGGEAA